LREAVMVSAMLLGGAVLVNLAQQHGVTGLMLGTAVAAVADAHAPMASLMALFGAGRIDPSNLLMGLMVAISVNAVTRSVVAALAGGWRFGLGVAMALALNLAASWVYLGIA